MKKFFSTRFKKFRIQKGLTQTETADLLSLSPRYVQKIESGNVNIPMNTIEHISKKLDMPLCHFFNKNLDPDHRLFDALEISCPLEILNHLPIAVCLMNSSGKMIFCNRTFQEKLKPVRADCNFWEIFSTETEKQNTKKYIQFLTENNPSPAPAPFFANQKMSDGSIAPIKIELSMIRNKSKQLVGFIGMLNFHPSW